MNFKEAKALLDAAVQEDNIPVTIEGVGSIRSNSTATMYKFTNGSYWEFHVNFHSGQWFEWKRDREDDWGVLRWVPIPELPNMEVKYES